MVDMDDKMEFTKGIFDGFIQNEPDWIIKHRLNYFLKLNNAKMPSFRHGLNINIKPENEINIVPKVKVKNDLELIYDATSGVKIFSGNTLESVKGKTHNNRVKMFLNDSWIDETDKITYLNETFINEFIIIHIPDKEISSPININLNVLESPTISAIFVLAEKNSKAKILFNKTGGKEYYGETVRIICQPNSLVEFISIQNLSNDTMNFQNRKAICEKDATIHWIDICLGSSYSKTRAESALNSNGANSSNTVLYLATKNQKFDVYTSSIHNAPDTNSDIVTKGVLNDSAKALSRGLVQINKNAAGSNGYEKQDALLLSDKAEADAIPNLEINNHDVKCSHGSTVGQIDYEKLFYLMSRGLSRENAQEIIVEGYFAPVLSNFDDETKEKIAHSISLRLQGGGKNE